ncbi:hypothetical protein PAXRUDRAFT_502547 [Paxillus rubicundulus Ve08.2h10]|uniref:Unplaced genomic scaffold scaffold_3466, whole genome shotgun sequence n=1 Tax=Paxillus rubicundulus Ve08.2h10 TaxID=930991 RepID=A0A0D0CJ11_9AGAM|nr:hypothetical protein PAXRUDRAFT_502547 [Paxillus rubicundulus Ve08.2h10]
MFCNHYVIGCPGRQLTLFSMSFFVLGSPLALPVYLSTRALFHARPFKFATLTSVDRLRRPIFSVLVMRPGRASELDSSRQVNNNLSIFFHRFISFV